MSDDSLHPERERLRRWLAPVRVHTRVTWVLAETVVMSALIVWIGTLVEPQDPLFIGAHVPWAWAAPLLLALRYGVMTGAGSLALLLIVWFAAYGEGRLPTPYFVGGLLLVTICGEFSGIWRGRIERLSETNSYLEDRIERVTGRLFTVQRSHELLQQELLQQPTTLRHALDNLVRRTLAGQHDASAAARAFLDHLAASCQVEDAQIIALDGEPGQLPTGFGAVLARIGRAEAVDWADPLVSFAIHRDRLAHVQMAHSESGEPTRHLIVAPLRIGAQRSPALLVVSHMPFLALQHENLQMIAVLCSVLSSAAEVSEAVGEVIEQVPACPARLAEELCRLDRLARDFGLLSHIVLLRFDDPARSEEQGLMAERRARAPDVIWTYTDADGRRRLLTLMPLGGRHVVEGYLASVGEMIVSRYREDTGARTLDDLAIVTRVLALGGNAPLGVELAALVHEDAPATPAALPPAAAADDTEAGR